MAKHKQIAVMMLALLLSSLILIGCSASKGSVEVKQGMAPGKNVDLSQMDHQNVTGQTVDANGKAVKIKGEGVLVSDVLHAGGVEATFIGDIKAESRDGNTVEITGSELNMANKTFLIQQDDGSWDLVILGDASDGCILKDTVLLHAENM